MEVLQQIQLRKVVGELSHSTHRVARRQGTLRKDSVVRNSTLQVSFSKKMDRELLIVCGYVNFEVLFP